MASSCSIKMTKARFSEIIRQVREGRVVTVSCRGKPVAEIRPVGRDSTLDERLEDLERCGVEPGAALYARCRHGWET